MSTRLVYHFCNEEFGLQNIEKSRLKVATIMDLNDPFELLAYSSPDRDMRGHIKKFKESAAKQFGFICFSKSFRSPVQWGHYADKHKGVCLGFEVPADNLHSIEYRSGWIEFDIGKYVDMSKKDRSECMQRLLRIKHSQWRYEREVRRILLLSESVKDGDLYFGSFESVGKLKEVIVGCNSKVTSDDLKKKLGDRYGQVDCFKVRTAFRSFQIVKNRDRSLWQ
ncbi:DUF2971 domain-containing protein [Pseudomonas sp. TCU-HL1]|uniref:DUF2971 domain-containing protein n=1 Tax=Pseudomonas sp. TCU-HL1 TaxID=1856685 RepID=UPI00083D47C9|nr:DUF2971 domain-containing protein [Pseudomonas sp. TCU-HL1]AOE86128.1 hypothetical protein THL1_3580 [Pseudomonas sp. TCU-HL1]